MASGFQFDLSLGGLGLKLRRRSRSSQPSGTLKHGRRPIDRRLPPSVVTAWLRQGLRSGMCLLCRVAHKADREYIWHLFDEGSDQQESIEAVRHACGFCDQHIEMLRRIETDGLKSTLAISTMFSDVVAGIVEDLREHVRKHDDRFRHEPKGAERDSWRRAIFLTAGWPAPTESAAEPERRR